jgi:hypothetical protein
MADLTGKSALVTGAQQGIGKAIAIALAKEGVDVAINYLDGKTAAEDVATAVQAAGREAVLLAGDVAAPGIPAALVAETLAAFGKIDILVNNAGVFPRVTFLDMTEEDWDFVHSINLKAGFFCAQAAGRAMIAAKTPGVIINLASSAIFGASPRGVHYSASKGGVVDARHGDGTCTVENPRQRHRARAHRHRAATLRRQRTGTRRKSGDDAVGTHGTAGRYRQCGGLSCVGEIRLHDGADVARQRRKLHGDMSPSSLR